MKRCGAPGDSKRHMHSGQKHRDGKGEDLELQDEAVWRAAEIQASHALRPKASRRNDGSTDTSGVFEIYPPGVWMGPIQNMSLTFVAASAACSPPTSRHTACQVH